MAVTGWGHEEDRRRSGEMGFDMHLVKPVTAKDLRLCSPISSRSSKSPLFRTLCQISRLTAQAPAPSEDPLRAPWRSAAASLLFCSFDRTKLGSWPEHRQTVPSIDDRLLDTAIDQFGRKGIEGASTRAIATAAGTTMSSITYHYGGKQGLYLAAARHIAEQMGERMAPVLAESERRAAKVEGPDAASAELLTIIDRFAAVMVHPESAAWARFIVREQMEPTEAFDVCTAA